MTTAYNVQMRGRAQSEEEMPKSGGVKAMQARFSQVDAPVKPNFTLPVKGPKPGPKPGGPKPALPKRITPERDLPPPPPSPPKERPLPIRFQDAPKLPQKSQKPPVLSPKSANTETKTKFVPSGGKSYTPNASVTPTFRNTPSGDQNKPPPGEPFLKSIKRPPLSPGSQGIDLGEILRRKQKLKDAPKIRDSMKGGQPVVLETKSGEVKKYVMKSLPNPILLGQPPAKPPKPKNAQLPHTQMLGKGTLIVRGEPEGAEELEDYDDIDSVQKATNKNKRSQVVSLISEYTEEEELEEYADVAGGDFELEDYDDIDGVRSKNAERTSDIYEEV